ncbi:MAG: Tol-Pal system beta propeller repeat protein TolB [Deltaproteobacteria bacterium]|nr:Tol-Pal system beta propeller repeat protein TolB [Deltaproteobacteria bacterium]
MKKIIPKLLLLSLISIPLSAQTPESTPGTSAGGDIQITQKHIYIILDQPSAEHKFPIAVPDLQITKGKDKDNFSSRVAEILKNDLKIAGYFEVLSKSNYPQETGLTKEQINFKQWSGIGAQALVKAGLEIDGKNLTFQWRLFDPNTSEMLVGKEYKVEKKSYRAAVHRFMDEILLALTGEKGIFSTKIVAACGPVGKRQITVMDIDGENRVQLTDNNSINVSPDWSKDGRQIAFTSYAKYWPEIFIVNTDGKGKAKRVTFNNSSNLTPAWSPDGSSIAISSNMMGDPEIFLIDSQGNKIAQITHSKGIDYSPAWSPDGQNLVYASERAGHLHLFTMDKNGGNIKRITFSGAFNDQPDWSPKGDKIAYSLQDGGGFDIYTMNIDGSMVQKVSNGMGSNESPSYSPDGRYIVYTSDRSHKSDIYIMLWEGTNPTAITKSGDCVNPDWSPRLP